MKNIIMVVFTIFIATTLIATSVSAHAQITPPPLNKTPPPAASNTTTPTTPPPAEEESKFIGKLTIPITEKDTLEIGIPLKSGEKYKIVTK